MEYPSSSLSIFRLFSHWQQKTQNSQSEFLSETAWQVICYYYMMKTIYLPAIRQQAGHLAHCVSELPYNQ